VPADTQVCDLDAQRVQRFGLISWLFRPPAGTICVVQTFQRGDPVSITNQNPVMFGRQLIKRIDK
jgi:hypothetical protein